MRRTEKGDEKKRLCVVGKVCTRSGLPQLLDPIPPHSAEECKAAKEVPPKNCVSVNGEGGEREERDASRLR
jgi:hypothetical protein